MNLPTKLRKAADYLREQHPRPSFDGEFIDQIMKDAALALWETEPKIELQAPKLDIGESAVAKKLIENVTEVNNIINKAVPPAGPSYDSSTIFSKMRELLRHAKTINAVPTMFLIGMGVRRSVLWSEFDKLPVTSDKDLPEDAIVLKSHWNTIGKLHVLDDSPVETDRAGASAYMRLIEQSRKLFDELFKRYPNWATEDVKWIVGPKVGTLLREKFGGKPAPLTLLGIEVFETVQTIPWHIELQYKVGDGWAVIGYFDVK